MDKQNTQNQYESSKDNYKIMDNQIDEIYAAIRKHENHMVKMESIIKTLLSDNQKMRQHIVHMKKQIENQNETIKCLAENRNQEENNRIGTEEKSSVDSAPLSGQGRQHLAQNDFRNKDPQNANICPNCGMKVDYGNKFCTNCGSLITSAAQAMNTGWAASAPNRTATSQNETTTIQSRKVKNDQNPMPSQSPDMVFNTEKSSNYQQSHQSVLQQGSFCPNCHAAISAEDQFCNYCGTSLKGVKKHQTKKQQVGTSILHIPEKNHEKSYTLKQTQNRVPSSYSSSSDRQFNKSGNRKNVCPSCGAKIVPGNLFCTECGSRID